MRRADPKAHNFRMRWAIVCFLSATLVAGTVHAQLAAVTGPPDRIIDGDTLVVAGMKIRLWGIDAPERGEPFAAQATSGLDDYVGKRVVTCQTQDIDRYGRIVAVCYVNGADLAAWLVRNGLARDWPKYSDGAYAEDEAEARQARRGMWR